MAFLGVAVLVGLGLLGWETYALTRSDDAAITNVVRIAFEEEPGAFMLVYGSFMLSFGGLSGHLFWCRCPKEG